MRLTDELDRLLLGAVGDDFVTLESVVDKLCPDGPIFSKHDPELLYSRLLTLLSDKLINAYLLHADPPYITPVKMSDRTLRMSWFYITQRGRKCLANNSRRRESLRPKDSNSQDQYTPAVNF
jgi:hypothetical protein